MLINIIDRIRLPFRKDKELYSSLYAIIGFYPHNITYYKTALLHKSIRHRNNKGKPINNERLEFLGDAVLDCAVGDIVFRHFPGKREGFLTNTRSKLVQRETLNKLAKEMGVSDLILSSGRSNTHNSYLGGNAFEALVGALYLDRGYDACMTFIKKRILTNMINIDKVAYKEVNFKSKLIEWTQKNKVKLEFKLIKGIDKVFEAKGERTKMEEEPVNAIPDTDETQAFMKPVDVPVEDNDKHETTFREHVFSEAESAVEEARTDALSEEAPSNKKDSREDIIAAAEAAAFEEEN